jgi:hypothetical protein
MAVKKGRREVAQAVAAVSGLVEVTLVGTSFSVIPADLFDLTFNDPQVGIDDDRMTDFKESLKVLLEEDDISATIDQIPENSNIVIEQVAEIVRLALALKAAHRRLG